MRILSSPALCRSISTHNREPQRPPRSCKPTALTSEVIFHEPRLSLSRTPIPASGDRWELPTASGPTAGIARLRTNPSSQEPRHDQHALRQLLVPVNEKTLPGHPGGRVGRRQGLSARSVGVLFLAFGGFIRTGLHLGKELGRLLQEILLAAFAAEDNEAIWLSGDPIGELR